MFSDSLPYLRPMSLVQRSKVKASVEDEGSSPSSSDEEVVEDTSLVEEAEGTLVTMAMAKMWVQQVAKVCPSC